MFLYDLKGPPNDDNGSLRIGRGKPGIFLCLFVALESSAGVNTAKDKTPILVEGPLATLWYAFWMKIDLRL